jgi:hypothetical protein
VGIPVRLGGHRPDSFRVEPFQPGGRVEPGGGEDWAGALLAVPLRRYRPAFAVAVAAEPGSGGAAPRPLALLSGPRRGRVLRARGPFALSGHWWDAGSAWRQAEWDLELESGHLLRLALVPPECWRLEGEYA